MGQDVRKRTATKRNGVNQMQARNETEHAIMSIAGCWLRAKRTYYRTDEFDRESRAALREKFLAYSDALVYLVMHRANNTVAESYTHDGGIALDVSGTVYALNDENEVFRYGNA